MKKRITALLLLGTMLLSLAACGLMPHEHTTVIDFGYRATCTQDGLSIGAHCGECGYVLSPQQVIKAPGHTPTTIEGYPATGFAEGLSDGTQCSVCGDTLTAQEKIPKVPPVEIKFETGIITAAPTVIKTNHLQLHIPANVYIPDTLVEDLNIITAAMEELSGLSFAGNPRYAKDLAKVTVLKSVDTESELLDSYASPFFGAFVSSGDLLDLYILIHECSHSLQWRQSSWSYCQWAMEGISTYTTHKTVIHLLEQDPQMVSVLNTEQNSLLQGYIQDYAETFSHPMEYWVKNSGSGAHTADYGIGFRFMWFLDETFGDYTSWILEYEKSNPYHAAYSNDGTVSADEQIALFKSVYGEDVFDRFYAWLGNNEYRFAHATAADLREAEKLIPYPAFGSWNDWRIIDHFGATYKDTYVDLEAGKQYLQAYKGKDISNLKLYVDPYNLLTGNIQPVTIEFYDANGYLLRTDSCITQTEFDLTGVSLLRLVGENTAKEIKVIDNVIGLK